ncbi:unnamed protein product [Phytophthora fragariaefolia]|uniref:Unnamed protein product n=1 Tax=Phytophthora fragariaefolia TaxID=1490495 RepID=A0A9W6XS79_9STRA|nr:unnamed protein product [Phytophthora fragariaefolia]
MRSNTKEHMLSILSLTKEQLHGSGATLAVHPETAMKVQKAKRANRGVRLLITPHEIEYPMVALSGGGMHGASIWSKIWSGLKSGLKYAKDTGILSKLADAAVAPASAYTGNPGAVMAARQGLKSLTGIGIEEEGGRMSLADVKTAGSKALAYAKRKGLITDAIDLVEKNLIEKAERPEHVDLIKQVRKGVRAKFGVGVGQNFFLVKGSAEAKAHMAALRALRKSGGSFRLF